ncbi:MAG: hypothetical protein V3S14_06100, partial [Anaerolineae bacterium]
CATPICGSGVKNLSKVQSLKLLTYTVRALPGGTAVFPDYGTAVFPTPYLFIVTVTDAPNDWGYVITKTFGVLAGSWSTDTITETLWVAGADPQPEPIIFEFTYHKVTRYIYLPVVMRNY